MHSGMTSNQIIGLDMPPNRLRRHSEKRFAPIRYLPSREASFPLYGLLMRS